MSREVVDGARARVELGQLDAADEMLRRALERERTPLVLAALAGVRAHAADPAAEALAREALALDPSCGLAHRHLAIALVQRRALAEAVTAAEHSAGLDPDDAGAHEILAVVRLAAGQPRAAIAAFERAAALTPLRAQPWFNIGTIAASIGELTQAAAAHTAALAREPTLRRALESLAQVLTRLERNAEAAATWRRVLDLDPQHPDALHLSVALAGEVADAPPPNYVADLFDAHAATFDQQLVDHLDYQGPHLVRTALVEHGPYPAVLELGCGTGLTGAALRDLCGHLTGIDVARAMLARAEERGVYDDLIAIDLVDYLGADGPAFDLIVAADVLSYVGDLAPLFATLRARLAPSGRFAFTVERGTGAGYALEPSGRWSHSEPYLADLAAAHALAIATCTEAPLRNDRQGPIVALVVVLVPNPAG